MPLRLLGVGLPLTIAAGTLVGAAVVPGVERRRGARARDRAGVHRRGARAGGRLGRARAVPDPAGAERRERAQRRAVRPAVLHRDRDRRDGCRRASSQSAAELVFEQIGYGLVGGVVAGVVGGHRTAAAVRRQLIEPHWIQILSLASAVLAAGVASALGGSIFIAAFTAGFVFGTLRDDTGGEVTYLVEEGGELFNAVTFIVFGAVILGPLLDEVTWQVAAVRDPQPDGRADAAGRARAARHRRPAPDGRVPRAGSGRAASPRSCSRSSSLDETTLPHLQTMLLTITITIAISVYAHGLTARPLTERYARWWASHPRDALPAMESRAGSGASPARAAGSVTVPDRRPRGTGMRPAAAPSTPAARPAARRAR